MKHATTQRSTKAAVPSALANAAAAAPTPADAASKDEFVRQAAYFYYEARGRIGGHELDDWLRAEAEFERLAQPGDSGTGAAGH